MIKMTIWGWISVQTLFNVRPVKKKKQYSTLLYFQRAGFFSLPQSFAVIMWPILELQDPEGIKAGAEVGIWPLKSL